MFKTKTVFIVGAGASFELGLPVGNDLKKIIAKKVNFWFEQNVRLTSGDSKLVDAIRLHINKLNDPKLNINTFLGSGRDMALAMPQALSIDNYLHAHFDDHATVFIGKLAIAESILEAERKSAIYFGANPTGPKSIENLLNHWHNIFCQILTEGVQTNNLERIFDNVVMITFNYDRCIEHYLAIWLQNYFRLNQGEAQKIASRLQVIRPYGQVDFLDWQNPITGRQGVPYGSDVSPNYLIEIAKQIRTFTEQLEDKASSDAIGKALLESRRIVFLGFSFGEQNMRLLQIPRSGAVNRSVDGTSCGMSNQNMGIIRKVIAERFFEGVNLANGPELDFQFEPCSTYFANNFRVLSS